MKKLLSQRANCYLEMMMFIPVAALLLLGGTDLGLSLVERSALRDAVREGLQDQSRYEGDISVLEPNGNELELNSSNLNILSQRVADRIASRIVSTKEGLANGDTPLDFRVEVSAVVYETNPVDGSIVNQSNVFTRVSNIGTPGFYLPSIAPNASYESPESYRTRLLTNAQSTTPSRYAISAGASFSEDGEILNTVTYLPYSIILHANVTAITQGFHGSYVSNKFGGLFGFQEQQVMAVRTLINQ